MQRIGMAVLFAALVSLAACQTAPDARSAPAVSADDYPRLKQMYERDPNAVVGRVSDTLPPERLVAIADLPVQKIMVGDAFTLLDAKGQEIALGSVIKITGDSVVVKYDPPTGPRPPQTGDLAIHFIITP
jgi:hypothetical protein